MKRSLVIGGIGLIFLLIGGCRFSLGNNAGTSSGTRVTPYMPKTSAVQPPDDAFIVNEGWPEYLPADIPYLFGEIDLVMGSEDTKTRIFYNQLSQQSIDQFVYDCEQNGFKLTYLVYEVNGEPTSSEKRLAAGDYDAIDFARGELRMRLEAGNGEGTLDIMLPKTGENPTVATQIPWPGELSGIIKQPDGCTVQSTADLAFGGYQISCQYANEDIHLDGFLAALSTSGFEETERQFNDQDELILIRYQNVDWVVEIHPQAFARMMTLIITPREN